MAKVLLALLLLVQAGLARIDVLNVTLLPANAVAGSSFSSQPVVTARVRAGDGALVIATGIDNGVTVRAFVNGSDPPSVLISGQQYVSASFLAGVATFTGLVIEKAGEHTLSFSVGFKAPVSAEQTVTVSPGPAVQLAMTQEPGRATGGLAFAAQPCVSIVDVFGNIVNVNGVVVTVSVSARPAGVTAGAAPLLVGGVTATGALLTATTVLGTATFSGLSFNPSGDGYRLSFSATLPGGVSAVVTGSRGFTVGIGPTARLVVTAQPSGARAGHSFTSQPLIELVDAGGNVNVDDSYSTVTVSLWDAERSPVTAAGGSMRRKVWKGGRPATLGPMYLRSLYPSGAIAATVSVGSEYIDLSIDPTRLGSGQTADGVLKDLPSLQGGDRVALNGPASAWVTGDVASGTAAVTLVDAGPGSMEEGSSPLPLSYPDLGKDGEVIRLIRGAPENRLRLQRAWAGPALTGVRLSKVVSALTRMVVRGRVTFQGLSVDMVGPRYRLLFTSSLVNASDQAVASAALDPVSLQWTGSNSRKAPVGRGTGAVGPGFGFGLNASDSSVPVPKRLAVLTDAFSVSMGDPAQLVVLRHASRAWAGGQPFGIQPIVAVADGGGNVLLDRFDDTISVTLAAPADLGATGYYGFASSCAVLLSASNRSFETGATLSGTGEVRTWAGVAEWWDAGVSRHTVPGGRPFVLIYTAIVAGFGTLKACSPLYVASSSESLLLPFTDPALGGAAPPGNGGDRSFGFGRGLQDTPGAADRFGHAVAVSEDVALVGAPSADSPTPEVQIIQTYGGGGHGARFGQWEGEVQTITLSAVWRPAVQSVRVSGAAPSAGLPSGTFTLSWAHPSDDYAVPTRSTRPIPVRASSSMLTAILEEDVLAMVGDERSRGSEERQRAAPGRVIVSLVLQNGTEVPAEEEEEGGVDDAGWPGVYTRTWHVTFNNVYGIVPLMTADGSSLVGSGGGSANVAVLPIQSATMLGGTFMLAMPAPLHAAAVLQTADHGSVDTPLPAFSAPSPSSAALYTTPALAWDIAPTALRHSLESNLNTGPVYVTARDIPYEEDVVGAQAIGARVLSVTFTPRPGSADVPTLQPDTSSLSGHGAHVAVRTLVPGAEPLGGSFKLTVRGVPTASIDITASAATVRTALLATGVVIDATVTRHEAPNTDAEDGFPSGRDVPAQADAPALGPAWVVTFTQLASPNTRTTYIEDGWEEVPDAPLLVWDPLYTAARDGVNVSELRPLGSSWTPCPAPVSGWDGADPLRHDPTLPRVACSGGGSSPATGGAEPGVLTGSGAGIDVVRAGWAPGRQPWQGREGSTARAGTPGTDTGAAFVFTRVLGGGEWVKRAKLKANDGEPTALFGHAVALSASPGYDTVSTPLSIAGLTELHAVAVVAAPGARVHGTDEVQDLSCTASGGHVALLFKEHRTVYLAYDAVAADLERAMNALPTPIHVSVSQVGGGASDPICSSQPTPGAGYTGPGTVRITFHWPRDGDLPPVVIDSTRLAGPTVSVREVTPGSRVSSGPNATGQTAGAVYVFEPTLSLARVRTDEWAQTFRLDPPGVVPQGGQGPHTLFGWSVAVTVDGVGGSVHTLAVGAPGDETDCGGVPGIARACGREAGAVHVWQRGSAGLYGGGPWVYHQLVLGTTHNTPGGAGMRFGWSVAFSAEGDTLVVGAPGSSSSPSSPSSMKHGRVYVFKRQQDDPAGLFFIDQMFEPQVDAGWNAAYQPLYGFGSAVSMGANSLVVGVPGAIAQSGAASGHATGCAYVYDRVGWGAPPLGGYFDLRTIACPESGRAGDRIGLSVAAGDHVMVVTGVTPSLGVEDGGLRGEAGSALVHPGAGAAGWPVSAPVHEVQLIFVHCPLPTGMSPNAGVTLGGTFMLSWKGRLTRRLPWNASPRILRSALENDCGTGTVKVSRAGPAHPTLAFQWRVTFIGAAVSTPTTALSDSAGPLDTPSLRPLPMLRPAQSMLVLEVSGATAAAAGSESAGEAALGAARAVLSPSSLTGRPFALGMGGVTPPLHAGWPLPVLRTIRLCTPSIPLRSTAAVYAREHSSAGQGYGSPWRPMALLAPHAWQASDAYGASAAISRSGRVALIGAPSRDHPSSQSPSSSLTGAAYMSTLLLLNARWVDASYDANDVSSVTGLPEHDATGAAGDTVSRGAHPGLGLASARDLAIRVCDPSCVIPPWPMSVGAPVGGLAGSALFTALPQGSVGAGQVRAYASWSDGDSWGWHASSGGLTPPAGSVAARAHAYPARSAAPGDGTGWASPGSQDVGWGPSLFVELDGIRTDSLGSDALARVWSDARVVGGGARAPVQRGAAGGGLDPSACSDASVATHECLFRRYALASLHGARPIIGAYDELGVQDYVRASKSVVMELVRGAGGLDAAALASSPGTFTEYTYGFPQAKPHSLSVSVTVVDDGIAEPRDEVFHATLWQPGLHAVYGGPLWAPLRVVEDGDGSVGAKGYSQALLPPTPTPSQSTGYGYGGSLAMDGRYALVGARGAARVLRYAAGAWVHTVHLPPPPLVAGLGRAAGYGSGVALWSSGTSGGVGSGGRWAAVSAPGAATVVVWRWDGPTEASSSPAAAWTLHASLSPDMAGALAGGTLSRGGDTVRRSMGDDRCGADGALAFMTDPSSPSPSPYPLLALGCSGHEAVFVYRLTGPGPGDTWSQSMVLRGNDYASYTPGGTGTDTPPLPVPVGFGSALTAAGSTLYVGAPRSGGYDGAAQGMGGGAAIPRESMDRQDERVSYGPGAVYVFTLLPGLAIASYTGHAKGGGRWVDIAAWPAGDTATFSRIAAGGEVKDLPLYDDGLRNALWVQHVVLTPPPSLAAPGALYGSALAADGVSLVVGAPGVGGGAGPSGTLSTGKGLPVTWDFESGDLAGWTAVGDAFTLQPVFGDNAGARPGYPTRLGPGPTSSAKHRGRYYLCTYEARPADLSAGYDAQARGEGHAGQRVTGVQADWTPDDVVAGSALTPPGAAQGDGPTGSLTSLPFLIAGATLSFLIGGGCDESSVFVELLVDGAPVLKATGGCETAMKRVAWDVAAYGGRMGALRIVDGSSSSPWGHISVDEIRFSWDHGRATEAGGAGAAAVYRLVRPVLGRVSGGAHTSTTSEARPAAHGPGRASPLSSQPCVPSLHPTLSCVWAMEAVLRPSDGRAGWAFGSSVALSDQAGIILVGAPRAQAPVESRPHGHLGGVFHTDSSSRADGGLNTGVWGYGQGSMWRQGHEEGEADASLRGSRSDATQLSDEDASLPTLSPSLQANIGTSRGGCGAAGVDVGRGGLGRAGERGRGRGESEDYGRGRSMADGAGAVYVYRAEPDKVSGGASSMGGATLLVSRLWTATGFEHSVLDAPRWGGGAGTRYGAALAVAGFRCLVGAPGGTDGVQPQWEGGGGSPRTGMAQSIDVGYTYLSFDPVDHSDPAFQQGPGARVHHAHRQAGSGGGVYASAASGVRVSRLSVGEGVGRGQKGTVGPSRTAGPEIVVPVYRLGVHPTGNPPVGGPQHLLRSESLHIAFGTRDVTARSVSDAHYAACAVLTPAARGRASCGDYVAQAGLMTFPPGTRRQDVIIPIVDDSCPEPETETFTLQLYLPGGVRVRGYGYTATIRIDDDDVASPADRAANARMDNVTAALDPLWQPIPDRISLCPLEDFPLGEHSEQ